MVVKRVLMAAACLLAAAGPSRAQVPVRTPVAKPKLLCDQVTTVADPKLEGGGVALSVRAEPPTFVAGASLQILQGSSVVATPWSGDLPSGAATPIVWDGRDALGKWLDTGSYTMRVQAAGVVTVELPLHLVRLGIREMEFQDSLGSNNEFPMVYFRKSGTYQFYATPAIHEYLNVQEAGELADLDMNNGDPRSVVPVHTATDMPVMEGANYDDDRYNYPLAYVQGSAPRVEVTFGSSACSKAGVAISPGYPVPGHEIRLQAWVASQVVASSAPIQPGGTALLDLVPLPSHLSRSEVEIEWKWQTRSGESAPWSDILGSTKTTHRFYTLLGEPNFKANPNGTQYAGPWVEVCEYMTTWAQALGLFPADAATLTQTHVQGFFGQTSGIPAALEGVKYDAGPLGGDSGSNRYFSSSTWRINLSSWLNNHAGGPFVNCSDNMGATTTMLSMLGVDNVRPMRLGGMTLKAIWGIGAPAYTTNLWGSGSHGFSYHHIVTDDNAQTVSDTCMQLDEDGTPGATPGIPGWNHRRPWLGIGGYRDLSAYNTVSYSLETLPGLY